VERLLRPKEVCQILGISYRTLLRWIDQGKIKTVKTEGGIYRIPYSEVRRILKNKTTSEVRAVIYARVSSSNKKSYLDRQIEYLTNYCLAKGYKVIDKLNLLAFRPLDTSLRCHYIDC